MCVNSNQSFVTAPLSLFRGPKVVPTTPGMPIQQPAKFLFLSIRCEQTSQSFSQTPKPFFAYCKKSMVLPFNPPLPITFTLNCAEKYPHSSRLFPFPLNLIIEIKVSNLFSYAEGNRRGQAWSFQVENSWPLNPLILSRSYSHISSFQKECRND